MLLRLNKMLEVQVSGLEGLVHEKQNSNLFCQYPWKQKQVKVGISSRVILTLLLAKE